MGRHSEPLIKGDIKTFLAEELVKMEGTGAVVIASRRIFVAQAAGNAEDAAAWITVLDRIYDLLGFAEEARATNWLRSKEQDPHG